ncbi:MAG: ATP-binding protein [Candidatus Cloacimonas sp.]|nr:GHKL domain-containing protein [Candidatus Cloacimonadota bacterium]
MSKKNRLDLKILKGEYEKRVFVFFFVVSFTLVAIFTLLEWQIVRMSIKQHEDKQSNESLTKINNEYDSYERDKLSVIQKLADNEKFVNAIKRGKCSTAQQFVEQHFEGYNGIVGVYDTNAEILCGNQLIFLKDYLKELVQSQKAVQKGFFPILLGNETFLLTYEYLYSPDENDDLELLGILTYLELFSLKNYEGISGLTTFPFSTIDNLDLLHLPDNQKSHLNFLKSLIGKATASQRENANLRIARDAATSLFVRYDVFEEPTLYIIQPYNRDYNNFAHRGLLVFLLIILAMSLLMISISGAWFSRKIIAPLEELNLTMKEIEQNPANIISMDKAYHGILGEIVNTFNQMNQSLNRYSQSLLEYKIIINNLDSAILWMDSSFKIILCNPKALQLFDATSYQEILGKYLPELVEMSDKLQKRAKEQGLFIPRLVLNNPHQQKFVKFVIFNIKAVDDSSGLRYVTSITDITKETREQKARERLELELIKSNRLAELGRLVEGIVHNINSPLNSIVGYAQLIKKEHPDLIDVEKIHQAGNNIAKMVKLLLSKIREDSISMMRPLNINDIVNQELEMCNHNTFYAQNVKLIKNLSEQELKINATAGEISLCIANLLNNAIQSMETREKKELTVNTHLKDNYIIVEIKDTGIGIEPDNIERIFEPDYSTKWSDLGTGFGLGLSITRSIMEKYEGKIEVSSIPNVGSTFTLYFKKS